MKRWQRRLFGILALGGGATGFTVTLQLLIAQGRGVNIPILIVVMAIYAWGVWCGLMLIEGRPGVERFNRRYWLLQIPVLSSPIASGFLWGGAKVSVTLNLWPLDLNFGAALGASFQYSFLQRTDRVALGVNLFAFVVATWLQHIRHQARVPADVAPAAALPASAAPAESTTLPAETARVSTEATRQ